MKKRIILFLLALLLTGCTAVAEETHPVTVPTEAVMETLPAPAVEAEAMALVEEVPPPTGVVLEPEAPGELEERCDVVYDGVPFMGLNNGMKVNVGIDIINALSRHYGVTVPLFIDNAEAVTRLEPCNSQVIRLVVSENDKELRTE